MKENPTKYVGPAAVIVFGVGMLIKGEILGGVALVGAGILVLAIVWAPSLVSRTFFLALGALICSGIFAFRAASNEISGKATYSSGMRGPSVTVTRAGSPAKFRELTNQNWALGACCLVVGGIGLMYCRKLDDCA